MEEKLKSLGLPAVIEWEADEYEERERSADWFWALGAISFFSIVLSFIFGNLLLALIIAIATFAIYAYENRPPQKMNIRLTPKGIQIGQDLYPYERADYFWIDEEREGLPMLIINYRRAFFPHLHISIEDVEPTLIRLYLRKFIEEEEHQKTFAEEISDLLGF
ncbi:MAG TPA: hypothetical protein PLK71_01210 [Candidatus Paceibacterota bacterium]|jgi:hypothetical protein|nr:hypothetical protein [Candidatus Paceibacterota bacterium]HPN89441.1 hypothetical protein [Candidatus Paceibacterota bacterium]